jgi:hypothetical protein
MIPGFKELFKDCTITERAFLMSLAGLNILERQIPKQTKEGTLKEIITIASQMTARWERVWTLAEKRLEVIEEVERIVCQSRGNTESPSK